MQKEGGNIRQAQRLVITHLDIHPLLKTVPMKYVITWSKHIAQAIINIDFVIAYDTI